MYPIAKPCFLLVLILFQTNNAHSWSQLKKEIKLHLGYHPDSLKNFTELTTEYGYVSEEHAVLTEDGYVLTMFRIPRGRNCVGEVRKTPVILKHGLFMNSDCWLDAGPKAGLAYLLSDLCYDLWIPNTRGNNYSKKHITLNPAKDFQFWDFAQQEFGYYDTPALINYVLSRTRAEKINYIGHSQGCADLIVMNSERPEYSRKIGVNIFMAPAARSTNMRSTFFRFVVNCFRILWPFLNRIGLFEVLPMGGIVQRTGAFLCKNAFLANTVCRFALSVMDASHPNSIETETMRVLSGHYPAGTSAKNMANFGQALNVDKFLKFDYGSIGNLNLYGTVEPPAYNISSVNTPTVIIHGRNDQLTTSADVEWLASTLPNVLELHYMPPPLWNHFDFTYSKLNSKFLLPKITGYLEKYSD